MINSKSLLLSTSLYTLLITLNSVAPHPASANMLSSSGEHQQTQSLVEYISTSDLSEQSKTFVKSVAERGIGFLENKELSKEERREKFRKMLEKNFDMKTIGRFALGRYWKTTSPAQRKEYLKLFEAMIVDIYSRRFGDYNGEKFEVLSTLPQQKGSSDVIVLSKIVPQNKPSISVNWRVRKKNNQLMIVDIMVENVSMALTQRSDFASVIQRGGGKIDVLLDHLRK